MFVGDFCAWLFLCSFWCNMIVEWLMFRRSWQSWNFIFIESHLCAQMTQTQKDHSGCPNLILIHFHELIGRLKCQMPSHCWSWCWPLRSWRKQPPQKLLHSSSYLSCNRRLFKLDQEKQLWRCVQALFLGQKSSSSVKIRPKMIVCSARFQAVRRRASGGVWG